MLTDMVSLRKQKERSKSPAKEKAPDARLHRGLFSEFSEP